MGCCGKLNPLLWLYSCRGALEFSTTPVEKPVENSYIKKCLIKYSWELHNARLFSETLGVVVVLARDLTSCQGFVTKLKNLRNLKNLKTARSENSVFPRVFEFFGNLRILNFEVFEISEKLWELNVL